MAAPPAYSEKSAELSPPGPPSPPPVVTAPEMETTDIDDGALQSVTVDNAGLLNGENPAFLTGLRLCAVVVAAALAIFLVTLDWTTAFAAMPAIVRQPDSIYDVAWYNTAFFMTIAGTLPAWGRAFKFHDFKSTVFLAIAFYELGTLVGLVSASNTSKVVGRALVGVGAAGLNCSAYTVVAVAVRPPLRPILTGLVGTAYGIAVGIGPLLGTTSTDKEPGSTLFYVKLVVRWLSVALITLFFKAPKTEAPEPASALRKILRLDPMGTTLVTCAIMDFSLAMQWGRATNYGLLLCSGSLFINFGVWQYFRGDRAIFPSRLVRNRAFIVPSIIGFFFSGAYLFIVYYIPVFHLKIQNTSPEMSGIHQLLMVLAITITMLASGALSSSSPFAYLVIAIGTGISLLSACLLVMMDTESPATKWIAYSIVACVGWGFASQVPMIVVQASASAANVPEATATLLFMQTLGSVLIVVTAQATVADVLATPMAYTKAFHLVFTIAFVVAEIASLAINFV